MVDNIDELKSEIATDWHLYPNEKPLKRDGDSIYGRYGIMGEVIKFENELVKTPYVTEVVFIDLKEPLGGYWKDVRGNNVEVRNWMYIPEVPV